MEDARHLDPKVKVVWLSPICLVMCIFTLIGAMAYLMLPQEFAVYGLPRGSIPVFVIGADLLFGIPAYMYAELVYRNFTFALTDSNIVVRQGVITRKSTVIPYVAIQDITSERSLLERLFGIATIEIETSGSSRLASETYIPGIANKDALVSEIMGRVSAAKNSHGASAVPQSPPTVEKILLAILKELRYVTSALGKAQIKSGQQAKGENGKQKGAMSEYEQYERFRKERQG